MSGQDNIFLIGFMGVGKSAVSNVLADKYGFSKIEMDAQIARREGMSIAHIFDAYGEAYFRDLETAFLRELSERSHTVVSCGGGVVLRDENVEYMHAGGRIVLLTASPETVFARVRHSDERPVLNGHMNVEYIKDLMERRRAHYEKAADVIVPTDEGSAADVAARVMEALNAGV